jgi:hypothetical protein
MALGTIYVITGQTITVSGSVLVGIESGHETVLFWNIQNAPTGTSPTIQFTLQEVDPNDGVTSIGNTVTGPVVSSQGVGQIVLRQTLSTVLLLKWTVTGSSPSFTGVNLTVSSREVGNAGTNLKTAIVSGSVSGNNTLVNAIAGSSIKVMAFAIQAQGTVNVKFKDGASTDLIAALSFQTREGTALATSYPSFLFATSSGNALILNLDSSVVVNGFVTYWTEID